MSSLTPSIRARALLAYGVLCPPHPRKWWFHGKLRRLLVAPSTGRHEVVRQGLRWSLTPEEYSHESLFWLNERDRWELYHLERIVPANGAVIDVGANYGYYALRVARAMGEQGIVHALEPNPTNFDNLERNIRLNDMSERVLPRRLGVDASGGIRRMVDDPTNMGHSRLTSDSDGFEIPVTTVDLFVGEVGFSRLDALLVDVEGVEQRAILGATRTIERFRPLIFVELWPPAMKRQDASVEEVADLLDGLGYVLRRADRRRLVPLDRLPSGDERVNCFAFPRESVASLD